ncbi:hypothetical protein TSA66_06520 [Noviherbaspirillum autotrophicum]|uniref:Solute-binding protein family 3/N-terminal domain-containing protein n=2 Tax=Noviherbaspirillum autotrophicum TaxID=709839 RepID=A0A0C2BKM9_9BURK|nr:hypothetical protein TSA66_06520 [Noviherbaspirillum autotrophicum]
MHGMLLLAILLGAWCMDASGTVTELYTAPQEFSEPKFILRQQDGRTVVEGLCVDIMHAIERTDPHIRFVLGPPPQSLARIEASLVAGELHVACGFLRTGKREHALHYIEPPLFSTDFYMAVRADDDVAVRNWEDVRRLGEDAVILAKYACAPALSSVEGLKTDFSAKDTKTNIQKLLAGRGRFFFHRSPGIEAAIRDAGAQGKVKILPVVMSRQPLYMVLSKAVPAHAATRIQTAIIRLEANGELAKLFAKWRADD